MQRELRSRDFIVSEVLSDDFCCIIRPEGADLPACPDADALRQAISTILPELKLRAEHGRGSLEDSFCRGASGTLKEILTHHFGWHMQAVINRNLHTFLISPSPQGTPIVIDPTIRQFVHPERRDQVPVVFTGSPQELIAALKAAHVEPKIISGYFKDLSVDCIIPVWPPVPESPLSELKAPRIF